MVYGHPAPKFLILLRIMGTSMVGCSLNEPGDIDLTRTAHAVYLQIISYGLADRMAAFNLARSSKVSLRACFKYSRRKLLTTSATSNKASPISEVTLLATDRKVYLLHFFAQPLFHVLIKPAGCIYPDINRGHALRIIHRFWLLTSIYNKVKQFFSGQVSNPLSQLSS